MAAVPDEIVQIERNFGIVEADLEGRGKDGIPCQAIVYTFR